mmetsp:Transcript_3220/g.12432  ORF Transcript_3220/g.12432 Transcript_3220/m.12432 type:complete len:214 (-) Transcript_3220:13-654(-)
MYVSSRARLWRLTGKHQCGHARTRTHDHRYCAPSRAFQWLNPSPRLAPQRFAWRGFGASSRLLAPRRGRERRRGDVSLATSEQRTHAHRSFALCGSFRRPEQRLGLVQLSSQRFEHLLPGHVHLTSRRRTANNRRGRLARALTLVFFRFSRPHVAHIARVHDRRLRERGNTIGRRRDGVARTFERRLERACAGCAGVNIARVFRVRVRDRVRA